MLNMLNNNLENYILPNINIIIKSFLYSLNTCYPNYLEASLKERLKYQTNSTSYPKHDETHCSQKICKVGFHPQQQPDETTKIHSITKPF